MSHHNVTVPLTLPAVTIDSRFLIPGPAFGLVGGGHVDLNYAAAVGDEIRITLLRELGVRVVVLGWTLFQGQFAFVGDVVDNENAGLARFSALYLVAMQRCTTAYGNRLNIIMIHHPAGRYARMVVRQTAVQEGSRPLHPMTDLAVVPGLNPPVVIIPGRGAVAEWHLTYRYEVSSRIYQLQRAQMQRAAAAILTSLTRKGIRVCQVHIMDRHQSIQDAYMIQVTQAPLPAISANASTIGIRSNFHNVLNMERPASAGPSTALPLGAIPQPPALIPPWVSHPQPPLSLPPPPVSSMQHQHQDQGRRGDRGGRGGRGAGNGRGGRGGRGGSSTRVDAGTRADAPTAASSGTSSQTISAGAPAPTATTSGPTTSGATTLGATSQTISQDHKRGISAETQLATHGGSKKRINLTLQVKVESSEEDELSESAYNLSPILVGKKQKKAREKKTAKAPKKTAVAKPAPSGSSGFKTTSSGPSASKTAPSGPSGSKTTPSVPSKVATPATEVEVAPPAAEVEVAPPAAEVEVAPPAVEVEVAAPPAAPEQLTVGSEPAQESGSAVEPSAVVAAVAVETDDLATALERFRQADAEAEEAQRKRKLALEEFLRIRGLGV